MTTTTTFSKRFSYWTVKMACPIADLQETYGLVADRVNGKSRTGPTVTVQKKDGSEVQVELCTIANTKIDGDYAEVLYGFREI